MTLFTHEFQSFFDELSLNNNKEWFHAHKDEYDLHVRVPFENLVDGLISEISRYDDLGEISARDCILRINKDTRFSKDKAPYNTYLTAFISTAGKKDKSIPGLFLRFSKDTVGIMGGCFGPNKFQVEKIRAHIQNNLRSFRELQTERDFVAKFETIRGNRMKRVPEDLRESAKKEPLLLNTQWYFVAERKDDFLYDSRLQKEIMEYYCSARPLNHFFAQALSS